jgi:hypothetical protein
MKSFLLCCCFFLFVLSRAAAQEKITPTDGFSVGGNIRQTYQVTLADITAIPAVSAGDLVVTNHTGVVKNTVHGIKGVLLKNLLSKALPDTDNPKLFSEYYIVCKANDGYTVVFSWNELFNSPTGEHVYVVTEKDGKTMQDMPDRISIVSTTDLKTGRRFLKGLQHIYFRRAS